MSSRQLKVWQNQVEMFNTGQKTVTYSACSARHHLLEQPSSAAQGACLPQQRNVMLLQASTSVAAPICSHGCAPPFSALPEAPGRESLPVLIAPVTQQASN